MDFVLYQQPSCPFCKHFRRLFHKHIPEGKEVSIPDHSSPIWLEKKIDFVPTVIAYRDGVEIERIGAVRLVGIRKKMWLDWLEMIGKKYGWDGLES